VIGKDNDKSHDDAVIVVFEGVSQAQFLFCMPRR